MRALDTGDEAWGFELSVGSRLGVDQVLEVVSDGEWWWSGFGPAVSYRRSGRRCWSAMIPTGPAAGPVEMTVKVIGLGSGFVRWQVCVGEAGSCLPLATATWRAVAGDDGGSLVRVSVVGSVASVAAMSAHADRFVTVDSMVTTTMLLYSAAIARIEAAEVPAVVRARGVA